MWIIEEHRPAGWVRISQALLAADATTALRLLQSERPWRGYRLVAA